MNGENIFSWIISLINFVILFYLFNGIVIKPMIAVSKEREEKADKALKEAESLYQDALKHKADYEKLLGTLPSEKEQIARHAQDEAARIKEYFAEEAVKEAAFVKQKAASESDIMRRQATLELQDMASEQSVARAKELLEQHLASGDKNAILAHFVERVGAIHVS